MEWIFVLTIFVAIIEVIVLPVFSLVEGPQVSHYFNCSCLVVTLILAVTLFRIISKDKNGLLKRKKGFVIITLVLQMLVFTLGLFYLDSKYGYTNWRYTNIMHLSPPS